ncbi:hypothetical protein KL86DES1_22273 [uncultured Desulfovibrio sp.]|uniref:Uncharacterized protein n=1 Tax=uncultured Desulfovibrio sp. TaxID=167968 RepID=A0A212LC87_9BACT|nr:hypothetical protein KL86DES1_22273 [uncultured Desulfovibrio sp.]
MHGNFNWIHVFPPMIVMFLCT